MLEVVVSAGFEAPPAVSVELGSGVIAQQDFALTPLGTEGEGEGEVGLSALFSADVLNGVAPLSVTFTDESSGGETEIISWFWNFGDGVAGNVQHPSHLYEDAGDYTVSLSVTTQSGESDVLTRKEIHHGGRWH